eukprot:CAMPEP_0119010576 /NCGR_PEP_ID=MMETSP1176-20130426/5103_1 /TAXON_ID=265551 /ORGANISM="Synedropsis recta cf, Strain CCMP1620" /LENGTH=192 /DNA_ID=CAMNT_0006963261 /DNA_START=64 /DNA_END=642 /DNA_ORIENTATION=-
MKWIKTLSAKVANRRNDDSPGSLRRSLKRKASSPGSLTDQSLSSLASVTHQSYGTPAPDNATWKIDNILCNGPPSEAEWWGEELFILQTRSRDEEDTTSTMEWSSSDDSTSKANSQPQRFHNCGFTAWETGRAEWRKQTVAKRPPKPASVRHDHVARGIRQGSRQFDLPGPMQLKDLIDVYTEVWDCDPDPW